MIEALKLALEALESYQNFIEDAHIIEGQWHWIGGASNVITALKEALAQPAREMTPRDISDKNVSKFLGEAPPPQRTWVGLKDEDVMEVWEKIKDGDWAIDFYDVIEAKLKEKNT